MPEQHHPTAKPNLAFAKIVANPTTTSWAQVYNAGSLFAVLALNGESNNEDATLPTIGRDIFNSLEAEFFSLEEKNLNSIKEAILSCLKKIPEETTTNLCLAYFKDNILYLFIYGSGKINIKRGEKIGNLLNKKEYSKELSAASGYTQNGDIFLLQTEQFVKNVPEEIIQKSFELSLPSDIAETLSPHVHEKEEGGSAAIIISYQGTSGQHPNYTTLSEEEKLASHPQPLYAQRSPIEESEEENDELEETNPKGIKFNFVSNFGFRASNFISQKIRLNHMQKIILSIVIVLVIVLTVSIFMTKKKQQNDRRSALFQQVYPPAKKSYDEGVALQKLNSDLAHDDFVKADQMIKNNLNKFLQGSTEQQQLQSLLSQVDAQLGGNTETNIPTKKVPVKEANVSDNDLLNIEKNSGSSLISAAQDTTNIYTLSSKAVTAIDKNTGKKTDIITNNNDWSSAQSIAPYQGNIYILDKNKGIIKYISGSGGFGKTNYFKDPAPDVATAQAIAIDSSIYILMQNGNILKYTKGQPDTFKIEGLSHPFSTPTKIFTDINTDNIYILDPQNYRIVKLGKDGNYQTEYAADQVKTAKDFEIDEKNQKIYFLSNGKIWQIDM